MWQALPVGATRKLGGSHPSSGPVRSPPLRLPQWRFVGQRTGPPRRRLLACLRARRRFHIPGVAAAACVRAPATTPGAGVAAGPPGRGLCAWIHAPARTTAVFPAAATPRPASINYILPRQLSAEILARAFAPRRATSGLVRIPPASVANGGESRSLGKRIDAAQCWRLCQPHPRSRHAGFRCAAALRGVAWEVPPKPSRRHPFPPLIATHAFVRHLRRAVAHGHANASVTRGGGIPPLSCPLHTARLVAGSRSSVPPDRPLPRSPRSGHAITVLSAIRRVERCTTSPVP